MSREDMLDWLNLGYDSLVGFWNDGEEPLYSITWMSTAHATLYDRIN
jgi:hypothetical protein